jgi:hypothetical protein
MPEVFTKEGINSQKTKNFIFQKPGMMPAIYDNATNYVTNQKLTLEMLKEISDSEDILEVTGEYTGSIGGYGPSHEHLDHKHTLIITIYRRSNSNSRNTNYFIESSRS